MADRDQKYYAGRTPSTWKETPGVKKHSPLCSPPPKFSFRMPGAPLLWAGRGDFTWLSWCPPLPCIDLAFCPVTIYLLAHCPHLPVTFPRAETRQKKERRGEV